MVAPGDASVLRGAMQRLMGDAGLLAELRRGIGPVATISQHLQQIESLYLQAFR